MQIAGHVADSKFIENMIRITKQIEDENQIKIDQVIFDPLISFHDSEENDNSRMRSTLDSILQVANEIKATPIVIHHANKEGEIRGATAIYDWARNVIKLEDKSFQGEKRIKFTHEKCNNFQMFDPFILSMDEYLNFNPIELEDTLPAGDRDRANAVKKALEMLGGYVETQSELAEFYCELHGVVKRTASRHILKAAEYGFIKLEHYEEGGKNKCKYSIPSGQTP